MLIACWHIGGGMLTYLLAFQLRFDGTVPLSCQVLFWNTLPVLIVIYLLIFALFNLYSGMWSYFSVDDLARMGMALVCATAIFAGIVFAFRGMMSVGFPRSIIAIEFLLMGSWMIGGRFISRYIREHAGHPDRSVSEPGDRVLVVGKLDDVDLLVRGTRHGAIGKIVGIVTGEPENRDRTIHGIRIHGSVNDVADVAQKNEASCILILPPFNRPRQMDDIVAKCAERGIAVTFRTIPSFADLASGQISASSIREVDIEDLLGRDAAQLDRSEVRRFIKGKRVMVTGAGGSIGREISLQVAGYEAEVVVLFEFSEYALYSIEQELRHRYPNLNIIASAGDVRHPEEVRNAIRTAGGVDVIYHAAAYKHVPLMEENVPACFRTNVAGTARLAQVAVECDVDRFVMISSDKAVRPTSIMGATKRLAERVITETEKGRTTFVAVRFGNVFDSSGSVIPLFKRQIAMGGPVTVTTPDVRRFFMTIPEAVDLVLMAGTVGRNGEIMVLEMGNSIRIADLANRLIELSGLVPEKDIAIQFIGLRPGEKEYEEVMTEDENVVRTSCEKIWVLTKNHDPDSLPSVDLDRIEKHILANDTAALRSIAREYVPENNFA